MVYQLLKRIVFSVVIIFVLTFFVFMLSNSISGNRIDAMLGEDGVSISQEAYDALVHEMGYDRPLLVRYVEWLNKFIHGDMGISEMQNRPVAGIVMSRIGPTLTLTFTSLLISVLLAIPLGTMAANKPYSIWDNLSSLIAFIGSSMPGFMLALFGIYVFAVKLGWVPTQGMYTTGQEHTLIDLIHHLALPACICGFQMSGNLIKQTRSAVLEVMHEDYIKTARSKGPGEGRVVILHALRNALIPIITQLSLSIPGLVGGSVVIERLFSWPGMGNLIITSVNSRDYTPLMAAAVLICTVVLLSNILIDFVYLLVDPRLAKEK